MQLVLSQVRKPIRELRKSLRSLPSNPPQKAVHNLRTRSRRVEAIGAALSPHQGKDAHQLLRAIKPLRKAAGDVRDMDVLEAKVRSLIRRTHDPSLKLLQAHLKSVRKQSAQVLVESFSAEKESIRRCLKRFSSSLDVCFAATPSETRVPHELFRELSRWPALNTGNLHAFRIKLKELRYMLQLMKSSNTTLMSALENTKVRIGDWHDWAELHRIAAEVLAPRKDQDAIEAIEAIEDRKLNLAMRSAQSLRNSFLHAQTDFDAIEP